MNYNPNKDYDVPASWKFATRHDRKLIRKWRKNRKLLHDYCEGIYHVEVYKISQNKVIHILPFVEAVFYQIVKLK